MRYHPSKEENTMGYTTEFKGSFNITPALKPEHKLYLEKFASSRRMIRETIGLGTFSDPVRKAVNLPLGWQGGYFIGELDVETRSCMIQVTAQTPPGSQPNLWCQWVPDETGTHLEWDQGEKFYNYREWLAYLTEHFLTPWGYTLSGEVSYQGENEDDHGVIKLPCDCCGCDEEGEY
jgi:hypothetical protein